MNTTSAPLPSSAIGFDVPLNWLAAGHLGIERRCATLHRLARRLRTHGSDGPARAAAVEVRRYFDLAAMDHHADEEVDLFPALIESMAGSDAVCLRELIFGLSAEHCALEKHWQWLRVALHKVAVGLPATLDSNEVESFVGLYQRHIARETTELLPMALRLLSDQELQRLSMGMRARRRLPGNTPHESF